MFNRIMAQLVRGPADANRLGFSIYPLVLVNQTSRGIFHKFCFILPFSGHSAYSVQFGQRKNIRKNNCRRQYHFPTNFLQSPTKEIPPFIIKINWVNNMDIIGFYLGLVGLIISNYNLFSIEIKCRIICHILLK